MLRERKTTLIYNQVSSLRRDPHFFGEGGVGRPVALAYLPSVVPHSLSGSDATRNPGGLRETGGAGGLRTTTSENMGRCGLAAAPSPI